MKKLLFVGMLALSAVSFAKGHGNMGGMNHGNGGMMNGLMSCGMMSGGHNGNHMGMNMSPELRKEMQGDMIKIQEKRLEISKIMNTSNPDMKKVEVLNGEIANIRAAHMTKMQQNMMKTN
ncbi:MAG: hypothetical protein ACRCY7_03030 [Cetobacterium sp.]|uniref:hypothetical protein n=1 Tax=Cetobacterium sp. TaxID=2071632 RepID=UPI003F2A5B30